MAEVCIHFVCSIETPTYERSAAGVDAMAAVSSATHGVAALQVAAEAKPKAESVAREGGDGVSEPSQLQHTGAKGTAEAAVDVSSSHACDLPSVASAAGDASESDAAGAAKAKSQSANDEPVALS